MDEKLIENITENQENNSKVVITDDDVKAAEEIRKEYRKSRSNLDKRIKENDIYWKMQHGDLETHERVDKDGKTVKVENPESISAWLFNSVINKHADAMDNYPEPNILPREESDRETAAQLGKVIMAILEQIKFEKTYSDAWWHKLKSGTAVYGVFWNNELAEGLGDIDIKEINILNVDFTPGITDIQKSKNVFIVDMELAEDVQTEYGIEINSTGKDAYIPSFTHDDNIDYSKYVAVVDWYYKKKIKYEDEYGRPKIKTVLHYVKYCDGQVLYASENDEDYRESGWYEHGKYPLEFDILYPQEDSPTGIGLVDIMRNPQKYIDKINSCLLANAEWGSRPRYFAKNSVGVNLDDFLDVNKTIVETTGNCDEEYLRPIETPRLDGNILAFVQYKIDELKETSGNRDFSQGATSSGVTSGSAIAALMEAGSKLSRDVIKASYMANNQIIYQVIELMRQFYDDNRVFRITKPNGYEFTSFSNENIKEQEVSVEGVVIGTRKPVFDIQCKSQKASPFSKLSQNELAKELLQLGFFNPQLADQALACIEMMEFEGKDMVIQKIQQNGLMYQKIQQMEVQMAQMRNLIAQLTGQNMPQTQTDVSGAVPGETNNKMGEINELGQEVSSDSPHIEDMRNNVRQQTEV